METKELIEKVTNNLKSFLIKKNEMYGNAALDPINIFTKHIEDDTDAYNSILVRLDDKLSRIKNADHLRKNDIVDLLGYIVLLCVDKGWDSFDEFID